MTDCERVEIVNLYHLAKTVVSSIPIEQSRLLGKNLRHQRMIWASRQFVKNHTEWTNIQAYKSLHAILIA